MRLIEMTETTTCNASGYNRVFGPKGKQFYVVDEEAEELVKAGSAEYMDVYEEDGRGEPETGED